MQKYGFIFALALFCTVPSSQAFGAKIRGKSGKKAYPPIIDKTLKAAAKCVPKTDKSGTKFCTGFRVTPKEVTELAQNGKAGCMERIEKSGYKIHTGNESSEIPGTDWASFINSTQLALSYHDRKIVAFKPAATFVDCVHEWIHVLQWTRASDKLLSPRVRDKTFKSVEKTVVDQVDRIEALESAGKKAHAIIQAGKAQEAIDQLKEYGELSNRLDEIEAHFFVLRNCERLHCTPDDRETALANLFKRREDLPEALRTEVEADAKGIVAEKKKVAVEKARADWKKQDDAHLNELITEKLKLDWPVLIRQINKAGLRMVAIDTAGAVPELGEKIASDVLVTLPAPTQSDLDVIRESKVLNGGALAKFVCSGDKEYKPAVFVTPNSTKASLVHEYIHSLQSAKNANYCGSVYGQRQVDADFNAGKMDRRAHDEKLLYAQAVNALAEEEVYGALLNHREAVGKPESLNNELMLNSLHEWLKTEP